MKLTRMDGFTAAVGMPPTRGHDLKPGSKKIVTPNGEGCPPHGGTT